MKAILISIGNELLNGSTINTNAAWLARELNILGYEVHQILSIADGYEPLVEVLQTLAPAQCVCIFTGGLGPTPDDTTRFDISRYLGIQLKEIPSLNDDILAIMGEEKGREYVKENRVQTLMPDGAEILRNPVGTAAGFAIKHQAHHYFFTPGVPREMQRIFKDEIAPRLSPSEAWVRKELMTYGIGESLQTRLLADVQIPAPLVFASLPSSGELLVRLSAPAEQIELLDQVWKQITEALSPYKEYWTSLSGQKLLQTVSEKLLATGQTVSVAESCTGGLLGATFTAQSGSSAYFIGGVQAYQNSVKNKCLKVKNETLEQFGAVSEECAAEMADGVRELIPSDISISITGIAGPSGGTKEKPVGTICFALSSNSGTVTETKHFRGDREQIRTRSILHALFMLFQKLHK